MTFLWYLASPYSHKDPLIMEKRAIQVSKLAGMFFKKGIDVLCPIASSHMVAKHSNLKSTKWNSWAQLDLNLLSRCDGMLIAALDDEWHYSVGMKAEFEFTQRALKLILVVNKKGDVLDFTTSSIAEKFNLVTGVTE